MPETTLITGAAGFAGGHLLDLLTGDGVSVVAWHRPGRVPPRMVANTAWQAVDLLDREAVGRALETLRPDRVYHCAGASHVGDSWQTTEPTFAANVRATHHLVAGLLDAGIAVRLLIPSSGLVYAPSEEPLGEDHPLLPRSPYGLSKLAQEMIGAQADGGVKASIARAFNHFGPRQEPSFVASAFARQIAEVEAGRREAEITVGNLDSSRDLTDVRDTVRAYRLILEQGVPGRVYNVCSGRAVAIRDLLDMLIARARVPVRVRVDPERYRPNDLPVVLGDRTRITTELGWQPAIPLERTLDDLLDFWRRSEAG
jgi:GDP-4-dehydro-6-deoxy-D-mannose reductase